MHIPVIHPPTVTFAGSYEMIAVKQAQEVDVVENLPTKVKS